MPVSKVMKVTEKNFVYVRGKRFAIPKGKSKAWALESRSFVIPCNSWWDEIRLPHTNIEIYYKEIPAVYATCEETRFKPAWMDDGGIEWLEDKQIETVKVSTAKKVLKTMEAMKAMKAMKAKKKS